MEGSFNMLIIWPERRDVSPEWIETQYDDAVANGDCDGLALNVEAKAFDLHDAGLITLSMYAPKE